MTIASPLWFVCGLALGGLHAGSLWMSMQHTPAVTIATEPLRLMLVAVALVAAAIAGGILPASLGWFVGYLSSTLFILVWGRSL